MSINDPSSTRARIERLQKEVSSLRSLQAKALKDAVYVGMTPAEAKEYDERRRRITDLVSELSSIDQVF
jgi:hypothetical protein